MELKEGMYVRTIYGIKRITDIICGQDIKFDNTDGFDEDLLNYHDYDGISKNSHTWEEIVIGEPKGKIIELIEVGDYVNGEKITRVIPQDICGYEVLDYQHIFVNDREIFNEDIKSIVTKEMFSSVECRMETD